MNGTSISQSLSQATGWPDVVKTVPSHKSLLIHIIFSSTVTELCIFASILLGLFYTIHSQPRVKAPYVGYRSWLEPTFLLRVRGLTSCKSIVAAGYEKVGDISRT
jgi:hypothetical protein